MIHVHVSEGSDDMAARVRANRPRAPRDARARLVVRSWRSLATGAATVLAAAVAAAQPSGSNFFPFPPAAQTFDPQAVLSAANDAGSRRREATAFAGLAQAVQVDLLTGEASSRIPIELPPGRKGMAPELALSYKSGGGNGLAGRGWDLRVPCVKRSTRFGVPLEWTSPPFPYAYLGDYVVVLPSGSVVLDRYLGNSGAIFFFGSSFEELLLRASLDTFGNIWTVTTKSGMTYTFGAGSAETRVGSDVSYAPHTLGMSRSLLNLRA
jgi:Salmonella virulence plasmid 65kDa B protein